MSIVSIQNEIVPVEIQQELVKGARSESEWLWTIGERALFVYEKYQARKEAGEAVLQNLHDIDVWAAVGHFANKSPSRVKRLSEVAAYFPQDVRNIIQANYGEWEFGYYEKAMSLEDPAQGFEFLRDFEAGELSPAGRRLGVGEFLLVYNTHILGKQCEDILPTDWSMDMSVADCSFMGVPFQDLLSGVRRLKKHLLPFTHKPEVQKVMALAEELEAELPKVMYAMGVPVLQVVDRNKKNVYS